MNVSECVRIVYACVGEYVLCEYMCVLVFCLNVSCTVFSALQM